MPVYMDIHELPEGVTPQDVAKAHAHDVELQGKYGVNYSKYWLNEGARKIFCLCHAPSAEAAVQVHKESHGLMAEKLIEVEPEMAELFLGSNIPDSTGAAVLPAAPDVRDPGIRTVLFTDIVDSTSLTRQMGDDAAMEFLGMHDSVVRKGLSDTGGREVKHTGDGIMASFVSAAAAVKCATQIQRQFAANKQEGTGRPIQVRIGLAAGEPVDHHNDLFGYTVQLAARLCAHAQPEQILASNVVAELCEGKILPFRELGEVMLKGFDHSVRVHTVSWSDGVASV
jgi:class 3 adenylate cyclase